MSSINKNEADQRLDQLAFGYVCNSLSGEDIEHVEQELIKLVEFQTLLAFWHQHCAELDNALNPISAPNVVWQNIKQEIKVPTGPHKILTLSKTSSIKNLWLDLRGVRWGAAASVMVLVLILFTVQPASQPNNPIYLDNQWIVQSNTNSNVITLVALSPPSMSPGITCNLWITSESGSLFVAELPEQGKIEVDLSNRPDVLRKLQQPGQLQITFDPKGNPPKTIHAAMVEASWPI
jgi:anti-sigma-K factor RskA